jgi:outer membrane protein OmpA-like peptidoglycan-associated protein
LPTQKSAQGVVDTLVKMGIDKSRLFAKGYGATQKIIIEANVRPVARTKEEAKWMYDQNNRVELRIISTSFN